MGRRKKSGNGRKDIVPAAWCGNGSGLQTSAGLAARARRAFIAESLLVFNLTQTEIVEALAEAGHINPKSGEPWSIGTINRDVAVLREEWEERAAQDYDKHVRSQLARIQNAQREAWAMGDLELYARFMEQEIKITGTGQRDMTNQNADPLGDGWDIFKVLEETRKRIEERNRLLGDGPIVDGEVLG